MKFKLTKEPNEELFSIFKEFCLESKPLDFCQLPSMHMRIIKIREYFHDLFADCECFTAFKDHQIVGFIVIEKQAEIASIVIGMGCYPKITFEEISEYFSEFRIFYKNKNPRIKTFKIEINRVYKKETFLKFIKKYMKPSKIELDKDPIIFYFD